MIYGVSEANLRDVELILISIVVFGEDDHARHVDCPPWPVYLKVPTLPYLKEHQSTVINYLTYCTSPKLRTTLCQA